MASSFAFSSARARSFAWKSSLFNLVKASRSFFSLAMESSRTRSSDALDVCSFESTSFFQFSAFILASFASATAAASSSLISSVAAAIGLSLATSASRVDFSRSAASYCSLSFFNFSFAEASIVFNMATSPLVCVADASVDLSLSSMFTCAVSTLTLMFAACNASFASSNDAFNILSSLSS